MSWSTPTLTDKTPNAGEFRFLTLGAARTGDMVFLIHHLTNERERIGRIISSVSSATPDANNALPFVAGDKPISGQFDRFHCASNHYA